MHMAAWSCSPKGKPCWLEHVRFTPARVHSQRRKASNTKCIGVELTYWGPRDTTKFRFQGPTLFEAAWLAKNKVPLFLALHQVLIPKSRYPTSQQTCCQNVGIYPLELGRLKGAIQLQRKYRLMARWTLFVITKPLNWAWMMKHPKTELSTSHE